MNLEAINADPLLHKTPIGRLKVVRMRDWLGVALVDERTGKERVIHVLKAGGCVLDAVYGKRNWEAPAIRRIYERRVEVEEKSREAVLADISRDQQRDLRRFLFKHEDAREALMSRFGQ